MTLILSVITPGYVMQASDRRRTEWEGDRIVGAIDNVNKAIFVENRATFAYTGLARIDGIDTAEYFHDRIGLALPRQGGSVEAALDMVVHDIEPLFLNVSAANRRQAFVGVGWTGEKAQAQRTPFITCASNFLDVDGRRAPSGAEQFTISTKRLANGGRYALHDAGAPLSPDTAALLHAQVDHHAATSDDPAPLAAILIEAIRREAAGDDAIGDGIMINCLPQILSAPGESVVMVGGPPRLDAATFTYLPSGAAPNPALAEYLGPLAATSGGVSMSGFTAGSLSGGPLPEGTFGFSVSTATDQPPRSGKVGQRIRSDRPGRNDPCWCGSGKKYKKCHHPR
jgi:hypothetical protein